MEKGWGVGPAIGFGVDIPVRNNLSIKGSLDYSLLEINIDKGYDYKGDELVKLDYDRSYRMNPLVLQFGVSYSF